MKYKEVEQMPRPLSDIHRIFRKPELIDVANELDVEPYLDLDRVSTRHLVFMIINHIEDHEFPDTEDCSETLFEFLLNIDYIDDDGEYIEPQDRSHYPDELSEVSVAENMPLTKDPECFSFAEIRDPSCKGCDIFDRCMVERKNVRPGCYGALFTPESEECRGCIEAATCRELSE